METKRTPTRPAEYFAGYREGHSDGYTGLTARPAVTGQSAAWSDGYARGHDAGRATRQYRDRTGQTGYRNPRHMRRILYGS